jgi:putative ABC transport system substrate-binding protein
MRRRALLVLLLAVAASRAVARAQVREKPWRVGFLYYGSRRSAVESGRYEAFVQEMSALGYAQGSNLVLVDYYAEGRVERLGSAAAALVRSEVDAIVATGGPATRAARQATASVPSIMTGTFDPVGEGFAARLARPGGNVTGTSALVSELLGKHLELLAECVPSLGRVAVLSKADNASHQKFVSVVDAAARKQSVKLLKEGARSAREIEASFASMARQGAQALVILGDTFFTQQARQIAALAVEHRMPSIYLTREYPEAGGTMSYGPDLTENFRRAARYVDKILNGARAGDLPIEQPTKLELIINVKTARAIGITVPRSMLLRADRVID